MASVPTKGRVVRPPWDETYELRYALFERLRSRVRYKNIAERDLRTHWNRVTATIRDTRGSRVWDLRQKRLADHWSKAQEATIDTYLSALDRVARTVLRLTANSEPPEWVLNHLHGDVAPAARLFGVPPGDYPPRAHKVWVERATLKLSVSPAMIDVEAELEGALAPPGSRIIHDESGYGEAAWAQFATNAHDMLEKLLTLMRDSYEYNTSPLFGPQKNAKNQAKQREDMELLVAWLFDKRPPCDRVTRARLQKRLKHLELDTPEY